MNPSAACKIDDLNIRLAVIVIAWGLAWLCLAGCVSGGPPAPQREPHAPVPLASDDSAALNQRGTAAPAQLPEDLCAKFRDQMWISITDYLNQEIDTPEANETAMDRMLARIEVAKKEVFEEADQRFPGAEQRIDQWRKQLEDEENDIWEKANLYGDSPDADQLE